MRLFDKPCQPGRTVMSSTLAMPTPNPADTRYAKALSLLPPERGPKQFLLVACPQCGTELVHHCSAAVAVRPKGGRPAHPRTREGIVVIPAWCEYRHRFNILFGCREGRTEVWTERRRVSVPGDFGLSSDPASTLPPPKLPDVQKDASSRRKPKGG